MRHTRWERLSALPSATAQCDVKHGMTTPCWKHRCECCGAWWWAVCDARVLWQVLDYQNTQATLFPLLATVFAFHFTGNMMKQMYALHGMSCVVLYRVDCFSLQVRVLC